MPDRSDRASVRALPVRLVVSFGKFWWDFLVGDTPELFVGAVFVVAAVALICRDPALRTVSAVLFPVLIASLLALSLWRAARRARG